MKAMLMDRPRPLEENPLRLADVPVPEPGPGEIRVKIAICGVCRTDVHIVEGELPSHRLPLIPGHQIVGIVDRIGEAVAGIELGTRVGIPWLYRTCGVCRFCRLGRENLCDNAQYTGYDVDGGFAEFVVVPAEFCYPLPGRYADQEAAPLLCAGVIGFQAYQATGLREPARLGLFGFGSSAHIVCQVARHLGHEVFVVSRTERELELARGLGAVWTGHADDDPGVLLDAVIVFAPSGELMVRALSRIDKGGRVVSAGIYATPLPGFDYSAIYPEKTLTSIANTSRRDIRSFLAVASECRINVAVTTYPLAEANQALLNIKLSRVSGSSVLVI